MEEILIPNESRHDVVTYELIVDNNPTDPSMQVLSISICKEANRIPTAAHCAAGRRGLRTNVRA